MGRISWYLFCLAFVVVGLLTAGTTAAFAIAAGLLAGWASSRRRAVVAAERFILLDHRGRKLAILGAAIEPLSETESFLRRFKAEIGGDPPASTMPAFELYYPNGQKAVTVGAYSDHLAGIFVFGGEGAPHAGLAVLPDGGAGLFVSRKGEVGLPAAEFALTKDGSSGIKLVDAQGRLVWQVPSSQSPEKDSRGGSVSV